MAGLQSSDRTASFNSGGGGGGGGGGVGSVGGSSVSMSSRPGSPRPNHTFGSLPRFPPSAVQGSKLASVLLLATSTPRPLTLLVSRMVTGVLYHGQPVLRHREAEVIAQQARMQELAQARSAFYNAFPSAALPTTTTTSTAAGATGGAGAATASTSVSPARVAAAAQPTRSLRYGPGGAPGMSLCGQTHARMVARPITRVSVDTSG